MFTFWLAVEKSPSFLWYWPVTGLLIGLGFLCKYTNAFELISVLVVMALVPRLRREFKRPGVYLLIGIFVFCTIPPIVWNAQHTWITLAHLRSRGNLDRGFGFHPAEVLSFLGQHFIVYSPLLFLALAWGVIASWRRISQQFKVLFLMWFGLPVFVFYLLLSFNKSAAPNWDALAFFGFGLVATYFWWERVQTNALLRICARVAVLVGLIMSMIALDTDLLRVAGYQLPRSDPSDRMRGWKSATEALEKMRNDLEAQLGEKLFLIADARDRASEIFVLSARQTSGRPGASARVHSRIARHGESVLVLAALRSVRRAKTWHATAGRRSLHRRERHQLVRRTRCAFYQGWRKGTCTSQHTSGISIQ
jgi:hypothetical protein